MNIPDHLSQSLETIFWVKNTLNSLMRIWDEKNLDPGSAINIPSATLKELKKFPSVLNLNKVNKGKKYDDIRLLLLMGNFIW